MSVSKEEMERIYKEMNAENDDQKMVCNELIFSVLAEPRNNTGYTTGRRDELRKAIYGETYGSLFEKTLFLSGYWSNDLSDIYCTSTGTSTSFGKLFQVLKDVEFISGVALRS